MTATLALLPPLAALFAVLCLRASGLIAAGLALAAASAIWLAGVFEPPTAQHGSRALADAAVMTALVAAMVVPGILFVEASGRRRSPEALAGLVQAMQLPVARSALLIAVGIGVAVECLTGMGVSLLVTVPLLLGLVDRRCAIGLALVGMSLMPWGALAISAHVGAKLAGLPLGDLTPWITRVSAPIAASLPLLALLFLPAIGGRDILFALLAGVVLVAGIAGAALVAGIEIAGVAGGLSVIALIALTAGNRRNLGMALRVPGLAPYAALIAAVIAQKLVVGPLAAAGISPQLATPRIAFDILTSPGVALLAATLATSAAAIDKGLVTRTLQRSWRPLGSIALFMLAARLTVETGGIVALVAVLQGLGPSAASVAVVLLGAVGGFATGSGVTGNALFMPSAAAAGEAMGHAGLFAALQNGASGHTAMAALPVAAILLSALPDRTNADDRNALRIGLMLAAVHVLTLSVAGLVWLRLAA